MEKLQITYCITIKGKVQGVFFRASTKKEADKLQLKGMVKNMPNGDVYAELQGEVDAIEAMKKWMQVGPEMARVDKIDVKIEKKEAFTSFEIIR